MANVKISFCISSYGRLVLLQSCLSSIYNQNIDNYEILIGSPKDLSKDIGGKVIFIRSEDHIGKTRNILKSKASGDWLVFLDEDVELEGINFIENFLIESKKNINDVYGGFYKTDYSSSLLDRAYNMTCNLWVLRGNLKGPQVLGGIYILKGSKFPDYFDGYSFGGEEFPYFSELIKNNCKISVSKKLSVLHRPGHSFKTFFKRAWLHGKFKQVDTLQGKRVSLVVEYRENIIVKGFAAAYFFIVYISQFFNKVKSLLKVKESNFSKNL